MLFDLNEEYITRWVRMPILPADNPLVKMYLCYIRYHNDSGFWKKLWLRLKIRYYKRLMKNG